MHVDRRQDRAEWAVMAAMLALCTILLVLQYRWTGALSRAESSAVQASLRARTVQVADSFDTELRRLTISLVPAVTELDTLGLQRAHAARLSGWLAHEARRPFRRVGVVAFGEGPDLILHEMDQRDGTLRHIEWPAAWESLRDQMRARSRGEGPPPAVSVDSLLVELPVFEAEREREWMIFELDLPYLTATWLPDLLTSAFPVDRQGPTPRVDVRSRSGGGPPVLRWPTADAPPARPPDASAPLFPAVGIGPLRNRRDASRWALQVWYGAEPIEAIVATTRMRNLVVAAALIGLIAVTAWARTQIAARARRLAARELAFVAGVSHELRTPLAAIRGAGHNLRTSLVTDVDKQRTYGTLIVERADQLTTMLEQLLSLASLRRSAHPATPASVDIADVVKQAVRATAEAAAQARCEVQVDVAPAMPRVLGDAAALRRAFENLITNALTHGACGGWVGVAAHGVTTSHTTAIEVSVADRGPGVPEDEQAEVWEPFVRGAASNAGSHRGFGLGLSLVREIVERHGGTAVLEPGEGIGARFVVRLPAAVEDV